MPASIFTRVRSSPCSGITVQQIDADQDLVRAYKRDSGRSWSMARKSPSTIPRDAKRRGSRTIYQTLALADNVDAAANLYLGRELRTRWGTLDDVAMEARPAR